MYMNGEILLRVVTATAEVARGLLFTPPTTSQQQLEAPSQKRISTEEVVYIFVNRAGWGYINICCFYKNS